MPDKKFLEEFPLYRKMKIDLPMHVKDIPRPAINRYCESCKSIQTFSMGNLWPEAGFMGTGADDDKSPRGRIKRAVYACAACRLGRVEFWVRFGETRYIQKIGQWPPWSISADKELSQMLDAQLNDVFSKGLICESQGFGIGAYSYYRRVLEQSINDLLDQISELLEGEELSKYAVALNETKQETIAENKIRLVKDLLPTSLKANGVNPLDVLYEIASEGIHELTDDECLEHAETLRSTLVYLVNQVHRSREEKKNFTVGMKKFLDRRADKGKGKGSS